MDYRQLMRMLAAGRIAVGSTLVLLPGVAGSQWIGDAARGRDVKVVIRAMGVRDLALGAGTLQALDGGEPVRSWVLMSALSDLVDFGATAVAMRRIGLRRALPVMVIAAVSAGLGALASEQLD
jgi:hypothetical protein